MDKIKARQSQYKDIKKRETQFGIYILMGNKDSL